MTEIKIVRIYITEADKLLNNIMNYLHNEMKVKGVTVFRAITGFGNSGAMHSTTLLSTSMDLPIVVEFFDELTKVNGTINHLKSLAGEGHVVSWMATCE